MSGKRCPLCACHHVPKCQATARTSQWAIEPLLAIAGRDTVHAWCGERSPHDATHQPGPAQRAAVLLAGQPCSLTAVMPDGALAKIRTKTAA